MAIKVRHDIKVTQVPGQESIGTVVMQSAEVVPDTLYMLICMLCAGEVDTTDDSNDKLNVVLKRKILICQDIVFLVSRGRKYTPKHVGIGVTVYQATRSKELVERFHTVGHSKSHETVLRLDNAIRNDTFGRYNTNGNVIAPRNFTENSHSSYTRYAIDNIDINE